MCGIMGYVGNRDAAKIVFDGLLALEYRGYDSAGISVLGDSVKTVKTVGRVGNLQSRLSELKGGVGIGHTRWATHGKPSNLNAHPHTSGRITVVHNGIIENYAYLKAELLSKGKKFLSDTDSEVIAALIDEFYDGDLLNAVWRASKLMKGSFAVLAICPDFDGIVAVKFASPLILGLGDGENILASDMPATADLCSRLILPDDGDYAVVTREKIVVYDGDLNVVDRGICANEAASYDLKLGNFPHYMYKEMHEGCDTVARTAESFFKLRGEVEKLFEGVEKIVLTGCGTAFHAAMLGRRYFELYSNYCVLAEVAGELRYRKAVGKGTLLIAVTQSGETADTVETARLYKKSGAKVLAITNSPYSAISNTADYCLPVVAGSEICVAATKSYLGQITALYLLAKCLKSISCVEIDCVIPEIRAALGTDVELLAQVCRRSRGVYFLGRNLDYISAKEGSLKLKEVSYIQCEGYLASELKHGTLAIVDESILCVFIITESSLAEKSINAVEQVLSRGGTAAVITTLGSVYARFSDRIYVRVIENSIEQLSPLVIGAVLQKLAYRTAILCGYDPDKPRNLAKSVTVE